MRKAIFILTFILVIGTCIPASASGENEKTSSSYKTPTKRRDDGRIKAESELDCYKLKVKSCKVDDNDVATIEFSIENTSNYDISGYMTNYDSKAYDDEGTCYDGNYLSLAIGNGDFQPNVTFTLPAELSMKFRMRIKNVDPSASVFKRINIYTWNHTKDQNGYMTIYNLPITREGDE